MIPKFVKKTLLSLIVLGILGCSFNAKFSSVPAAKGTKENPILGEACHNKFIRLLKYEKMPGKGYWTQWFVIDSDDEWTEKIKWLKETNRRYLTLAVLDPDFQH